MSCLSYLDVLWDECLVAVQLLFWDLQLPWFVQNNMQHPCLVPIKILLRALKLKCSYHTVVLIRLDLLFCQLLLSENYVQSIIVLSEKLADWKRVHICAFFPTELSLTSMKETRQPQHDNSWSSGKRNKSSVASVSLRHFFYVYS